MGSFGAADLARSFAYIRSIDDSDGRGAPVLVLLFTSVIGAPNFLACFIIGHFSADLKGLASSMGNTAARILFGALYYLLPNLANYNFITYASHGHLPAAIHVAAAILYALIYVAVILAAATRSSGNATLNDGIIYQENLAASLLMSTRAI